jgi:cytochrome c oxidase subunit IV
MSEQHTHEHAGPNFQAYMIVFFVLCVCTALSFVVGQFMGHNHTSASIIMVIAAIKAALVAGIFMHLMFDWGKVYCIVIPVSILTVMMVIILSIDQVLVWHSFPESPVPLIK